jgi:hypothetical protein
MAWAADNVMQLGTSMLQLLNFYAYQPVVDFLANYGVFVVLASIACFVIAWIAAMSKKEIPIVDMLKNGVFAYFTYFILPIVMIVGVGFVQNVSQSISTTNSPSAAIVKDNVTDVIAVDNANWDLSTINTLRTQGKGAPNFIGESSDSTGTLSLPKDELDYINPTKTISSDDINNMSDYGQKVVSQQLSYGGYTDGKYDPHKATLTTFPDNIFQEKGAYYEYSWNFWTIFLSLLASILFTGVLLFRMARLETNIFLNWTTANVISLTQWGNTKRNWEVLSKIGMGLVTLLFTQSLTVLFNLGLSQLSDLLQAGKINIVAFLLLLFGFGMEMIDGPALWQQLFGIDAGIQSGWRTAWAVASTTRRLNDWFNPWNKRRRAERAAKTESKSNKQSSSGTSSQPEQKSGTDAKMPEDGKQKNTRPENKETGQSTTPPTDTGEQETPQTPDSKDQPSKQKDEKGKPQAQSDKKTGTNETDLPIPDAPVDELNHPEAGQSEFNEQQEKKKRGMSKSDEWKAPWSVPGPEHRKQSEPANKTKDNFVNPFEENLKAMDDYWSNDQNIPPAPTLPDYLEGDDYYGV